MNDSILTPFLNRAGGDFDPAGWFHLVPIGEFPVTRKEKNGAKKTYIQVVDETSADRIVAAFANRRAANPDFKILIDFEHFSHDTGKSTEAACWITDLEKRANGVWAKGEWSDVGETAIRNRRYRYLSPVWFPRQTEKLDASRFRPVEVNDAGLTNKPNLGDALTPFWNRADESFNGREAKSQKPETKNNMKEQLIALLGLPAEADDAAVLAAVTALKDASEKAAADAAPLKNRLAALETAHRALLGDAVTKELEANRDVIPEGQQDAWKNRLESDFTGTATLLRGLKRPEAAKAAVHDAGKGAAGAARKTVAAPNENDDPFLNRVREVMSADKLTEIQAIDRVAASDPALYRDYAAGFRSGITKS